MTAGILFAGLLGLSEALLGAWKDTLFEPFELTKFVRSPIVVMLWALIIGLWWFPGDHWFLVGASAMALERLSVETWKAMLRRPPGKFARSGRDNGWLSERLAGTRSQG